MTYCFIRAIECENGTTYGSILNSMRATIRSTSNEMSGGPVTTLISMLLTGGSLAGGSRQVLAPITLKHVNAHVLICLHPGLSSLFICITPYPLNKHTAMDKDGVYAPEMIQRIQYLNSTVLLLSKSLTSQFCCGLLTILQWPFQILEWSEIFSPCLFLGGVIKRDFQITINLGATQAGQVGYWDNPIPAPNLGWHEPGPRQLRQFEIQVQAGFQNHLSTIQVETGLDTQISYGIFIHSEEHLNPRFIYMTQHYYVIRVPRPGLNSHWTQKFRPQPGFRKSFWILLSYWCTRVLWLIL